MVALMVAAARKGFASVTRKDKFRYKKRKQNGSDIIYKQTYFVANLCKSVQMAFPVISLCKKCPWIEWCIGFKPFLS